MVRFIRYLLDHPARVSFVWYAAAVVIGGFLLSMPVCQAPSAEPLGPVDATFTATSAVCVTGLTVVSTGNDLSWMGQIVVLVLIQLGGIGIISVTTFVTLSMGARQGLRQRSLLADTLGAGQEPDLKWVLAHVIRFTLLFEASGAILLTIRFLFDHAPGEAVWHAVFHSISAFCNAGFSLNDDSLARYQGDPFVNLTIMTLVIVGGIGYPVMIDLLRNRHGSWADRWVGLTLHSKMMLVGTAILLTLGTASVLILEWDGALREMSWPRRLMVAGFHSVTCRTAGFNTLDIGSLTNATLFISVLLMVVGAGPCSTAGGFKVSTLAVLVLRSWSTFRGNARLHVAHRTLPARVVDRAIATALLFAVVSIAALTILLVLEQSSEPHAQSQGLFMDALFEVVSALGTVGLSVGMTPHLTTAGRWIIITLMFIGRLGPITVFAALSRVPREQAIEFASEEVLIG
jgi:trk system potassium uptake protein TrkH